MGYDGIMDETPTQRLLRRCAEQAERARVRREESRRSFIAGQVRLDLDTAEAADHRDVA
jgi:hypothetical protein